MHSLRLQLKLIKILIPTNVRAGDKHECPVRPGRPRSLQVAGRGALISPGVAGRGSRGAGRSHSRSAPSPLTRNPLSPKPQPLTQTRPRTRKRMHTHTTPPPPPLSHLQKRARAPRAHTVEVYCLENSPSPGGGACRPSESRSFISFTRIRTAVRSAL